MRQRTALKVKVGDTIHLRSALHEWGARSYTVTEIDYGLGSDPLVRYPLFKTENNGIFSYLLVRIAQNKKGQVI